MNARKARVTGTSALSVLVCSLSLLLVGCSPSTGPRSPSLKLVPLAPNSRVLLHVRVCNRGTNAFCALQLVVVGRGYRTAVAMIDSETRLLHALRWRRVNADTGLERAAYSPSGRLRLTYATAHGELESIELGWTQRRRKITVALAHTLFANTPALALLVEEGSG
jgi:hypothetical protein